MRTPLSKLVYFGAKGALRKILGSVGQKWISQNSTKADPFGRWEAESLRAGERKTSTPCLPPPKSDGDKSNFFLPNVDLYYKSKKQ